MKHLVLGSEGQIGKYVCDEIEKNGDEVIRWDIVLGSEYDLRDTRNTLDLSRAMSNSDFVHFLAYDVGGAKYLAAKQNSIWYIENNMKIMNNTFWALQDTGKPFYFASSQMQNMTDSAYGTLKNVGEFYTRALHGINVRFWNVYGYESDPEKTHVITDFIKMALTEGKILCRTNGQEYRHFTHARDAAKLLYRITKTDYAQLTSEESIPVVSGYEVKIQDIAWMIARIVGDTETYFSAKEDKSQTIINMAPNPYMLKDDFGLYIERNERVRLDHGLIEMIKLIAYDLQMEVELNEDLDYWI